MGKPTADPETLREEWQEKHDPNLEDLQGMRKFIEERVGDQSPQIPEEDQVLAGDSGDTHLKHGKFNNFK